MMLNKALSYASKGWVVLPLTHGNKHPLTPHGFKDASRDPEVIKRWWTQCPEANIGIATGVISGLVVVDVDVKNGAKGKESLDSLSGMTPTLTAQTPSGGWHLYYASPGPTRCRTGLLPGIDIRADGGYIVAPGSTIDGKPYEWVDAETRLVMLPDTIAKLLSNTNECKATVLSNDTAVIGEGLRNSTLASLAGSMRHRNLQYAEIVPALKAINTIRCQPPLPETEVEAIANSICNYSAGGKDSEDETCPPGFTDDALALGFSEKYAADWRYVAAWGYWLNWDNKCWRKETTLRAFDLVRAVCREAASLSTKPSVMSKIASASTVGAVERLARADRRHAATTSQWDTGTWMINTASGMVDLQSGQVYPHDRTLYCTKITTAGFKNDTPKPELWLKFLDDITAGDKELQAYLARVAGYALTGETSEQALFFLYGTGANGKSVFLNTLSDVLGDYATNAPIDTFMETKQTQHPTDLAGLRGARLVTSIEVEKGRRWAEAKIKTLTGSDKISARFMRQDYFEYKPQFKLIIAGNNRPTIREVDEAMKRRLHLIPFTVTIPAAQRDQGLQEKLLKERDGILRWAVEGCLDWQRNGLKPPQCVVAATEEYIEAEDSFGRWISDACILDANTQTPTNDLYQSWKLWSENCGEYTGSLKKFSEEMQKRGFVRSRTNSQRTFMGIAPQNINRVEGII